jgi:chemotaxis protein methyltransferase CheR
MRITDFDLYKDLLKKESGLVLTSDKSYLLDSRLNPVAKKWGYPSLETMTVALQGMPDKDLITDIVEAMTTNETSFFRDQRPFDLFTQNVLPHIKKSKQATKQLKMWCAAASTGQESYSISMLLKEDPDMSSWNISFKATDISTEVLEQAREGLYSQFEVQRGLPIQLLMKYFTQDNDRWRLSSDIKNMVQFNYFNLLDSMSSLGKFDIIFCRNVLIYFDEAAKSDILDRMAAQLEDDGFLFLGGAETVLGLSSTFQPMPDCRGIYVKSSHPALQTAQSSSQALA